MSGQNMVEWIQKRSPATEFVFIAALTFVPMTFFSMVAMLATDRQILFTNGSVVRTLIYEMLVLGVTALVLRVRGWKLSDFGTKISWRLTGMGIALFIVWMFVHFHCYVVATMIFGELTFHPGFAHGNVRVAVPLICVTAVVNPVFEEFFVVGYVFNALERLRSARFALIASAGLRLAYHLYQGPLGVVTIIPMALIFGCAYTRWRRLWPLVFAHGIMDLVGLLVLRGTY